MPKPRLQQMARQTEVRSETATNISWLLVAEPCVEVVYGRGGGCVWGESKAFIGVTVGRSDKQNNEARESARKRRAAENGS